MCYGDGEIEHLSRLPTAVLADHHRMVSEGIARLLARTVHVTAVAHTGRTLVDEVVTNAPDIVISGISMQNGSGIDALLELRRSGIRTPFVFFSMHSQPSLVARAIRSGAAGYVLKSGTSSELVTAIDRCLAGGAYVTPTLATSTVRGRCKDTYELSPRQTEVLRLVSQGLGSKQAAAALGVSVRTLESHRYHLFQVFDVHSVLDLVRKAEALGVLLPRSMTTEA